MIRGLVELSFGTCRLKMVRLNLGWREMSLALRHLFRRGWASRDSANASVVTHTVHRGVIHDDRLVIDVRYVPHVVYRAVIEEDPPVPISSFVAKTFVAKTIDNAAVESHVRPPVALMKNIDAITPTPITRRPEETRFGHQHPRAGHPEEPIVPVSPVAGCPYIALAGAKRLLVHRQQWRGDCN